MNQQLEQVIAAVLQNLKIECSRGTHISGTEDQVTVTLKFNDTVISEDSVDVKTY